MDKPLVVFVVRRFGDSNETIGADPFEDFCTYIVNTFYIKAILKVFPNFVLFILDITITLRT